jgi:hypothetical protein
MGLFLFGSCNGTRAKVSTAVVTIADIFTMKFCPCKHSLKIKSWISYINSFERVA